MRIVKIFLEGEWWWGVEVEGESPPPPPSDPSTPILQRVFSFYRLGKTLRELCPTEEELERFAVKESCPSWLKPKSKPTLSITLDELLGGL